MFGDYHTPDLLSGSPQTSLIGNEINFTLQKVPQLDAETTRLV
jgi:ABC-type spermidine/putrescine transport system permease subunit I